MTDYESFVSRKLAASPATGLAEIPPLHTALFPFQRDLTAWALKRGRAGMFVSTGLGKSLIELCWLDAIAKHTGRDVLLLTPLAVARQTQRIADWLGIKTTVARELCDVAPGITIINYDRVQKLDPSRFVAVALDEAGILKGLDGATRKYLTEAFAATPFRLSATATPAPNDWMELGQQAEFLGICTRAEMLAQFFVNDSSDTGEWRLKGHGRKAFWRWLASWAAVIRSPADLGYDSTGYDLPPLTIHTHIVEASGASKRDGMLFAMPAQGLSEVRAAKRESLGDRVALAASLVAKEPSEPWLVFGELNAETDALEAALTKSVQVAGSDSAEIKAERLLAFADGGIQTLISKARIAGIGLNLQRCARILCVGTTFSWEDFHQLVRRCWRYGQTREVHVHLICGQMEVATLKAIERKEAQAKQMIDEVIKVAGEAMRAEIRGAVHEQVDYVPKECVSGDNWTLYNADCVDVLRGLPDESIHLTVTSPPYLNLYVYNSSSRDIGNSRTDEDFWGHFRFVIKELYRLTKPGRIVAIDCMNVPAMKSKDGFIGIKDFRGDIIREFKEVGFIHHSEHCMWKDPLVEATRTKALGLMHKQLMKDSSMSRAGIPQYLVAFRKPGDNPEPIPHANGLEWFFGENPPTAGNLSHERWRRYASPVWMDIDFTDTLNYRIARENDDEKHVCPFSLQIIERALHLWSNPGDTVLDPFNGIGSTGYISLKNGRKYIGAELKSSYYETAVSNLRSVGRQLSLLGGT